MSETHVHGIDEASMERRTFLKGSMTAAALLGAAGMFGCAPNAAKQEGMKQEEAETADMPDTGAVDPTAEYECWLPPQGEVAFESEPVTDIAQTEDWDVVIVGMGAAGSAAAAYASANGLKTLVVEKMSVPAANPGDIFVINSKVQEQHQFPCPTFKDFMEALMTSSAYRANGPKLAALYHHSGEAFDWLYDNALVPAGIEAEPTFPAFPGIMMEGWTRCVNANITWVGGRNQRQADVHKSIADLALAQGAEIRFDTPAVQLVQDGNGAVTGVVVKGSDGAYTQLNASKGVLLATGGYAANMERMKKYMRPRDYATIAAVQFANVGVTGDGHEMGLAVGAAEDDAPHSALLNSYGIVDAHMMGIPALFIPWIRVNEQGRRFVNEEVPVSMLGGAIINQTHGRCWTVLDANYPQAAAQLKTAYLSNDPTIADGSVAVIGQMIEEGALIQADTVEELAEKMGVDAATLKETFERTTRDAASGVDTLFEKEFLYPLDTPPFYAIHEGSTLLSTCSGLHTDEVARVVTPEGDVIPGLYAIGECAGGLWAGGMYTHHVYGGDWAAAITFAYLAVQDLLAA